jgi:hypothetical protein
LQNCFKNQPIEKNSSLFLGWTILPIGYSAYCIVVAFLDQEKKDKKERINSTNS